MATKKKSGIYSPVSIEALRIIAGQSNQSPRLLLAYLTLSRFAGQQATGEFAANQLTGAGAEAIRKSQNIRWQRADDLLKALLRLKVIEPAPPEHKVGRSAATYTLKFKGDVNIPHALIDGLKNVPGIARLFDAKHNAKPDVVASAIVTLVHCYKHNNMQLHGGISTDMLFQNWQFILNSEGRGFKATARRDGDLVPSGSILLFAEVASTLGISENTEIRSEWKPIFREGVRLLSESGLIYESVTLFDDRRNPLLPLRINDFHAAKGSEPSVVEDVPGSAFYQSKNIEELWFFTPTNLLAIGAKIIGVSRPRFRGSDAPTKKGLERDQACVAAHKKSLAHLDMIDDLGDA